MLSKTVYPEVSGITNFLLDSMSALVTFSNQPNQSRVSQGGRITPTANTMEPVVAKYANIKKQHKKNITAHVISSVRMMLKSNIS